MPKKEPAKHEYLVGPLLPDTAERITYTITFRRSDGVSCVITTSEAQRFAKLLITRTSGPFLRALILALTDRLRQ